MGKESNLIFQKDGPDALAAINDFRHKQLGPLVTDIVKNPAQYSGIDVMDAIRDQAKAHGLEFQYRAHPHAPKELWLFVWSPKHETPCFDCTWHNPQAIGMVEKGT